ncbi:hypothetical protein TPY_3055 [Sulfobacillus acidophilus TPY]|nr:hypothetical protein TPY_3055 [Sulfobacillus acidophilus TPY]
MADRNDKTADNGSRHDCGWGQAIGAVADVTMGFDSLPSALSSGHSGRATV